MQAENTIAFKEWAVVCDALASGLQTIILRKGGIHEGREGFRVEHDEFWLLPTAFHQEPEALSDAGAALLPQTLERRPPPGEFRVQHYAAVEQVYRIEDECRLNDLADLHVWSEQTLRQRFHYREPGIFLLLVRVFQAAEPFTAADSPYLAGCRSWVTLDQARSTAGLTPVLDDEKYTHFSSETIRRLRLPLQ